MSTDNRSRRLAALDRLSNTARRYAAVSQQQSVVLANYLLAKHDEDEWLEVQRATPIFAKWDRVLLSVSDAIGESEIALDQALTITTLLTNNQFDLTDSDWRKQLSLKLFNFARESVAQSAKSVDSISPETDWLRLEKFLGQAYRDRTGLLRIDVPAALPRNAASLTGLCLLHKLDSSATMSRTKRIIDAVESSTTNEIHQIVLFNRLLTKDANWNRNDNLPMATRLLLSELDLMNMWNEQRKKRLRQLIQRKKL